MKGRKGKERRLRGLSANELDGLAKVEQRGEGRGREYRKEEEEDEE